MRIVPFRSACFRAKSSTCLRNRKRSASSTCRSKCPTATSTDCRARSRSSRSVQRIADSSTGCARHADYHAYLTIDQRSVAPGTLHREAPCHVDGFQGARWNPKCLANHSYTVSDVAADRVLRPAVRFRRARRKRSRLFLGDERASRRDERRHTWQPRARRDHDDGLLLGASRRRKRIDRTRFSDVVAAVVRGASPRVRPPRQRAQPAFRLRLEDGRSRHRAARAPRVSTSGRRIAPRVPVARSRGNALPKDAPKTKPRLHR